MPQASSDPLLGMTQRMGASLKISLKTTSPVFVLLSHIAALSTDQVPGSILDELMTCILLRKYTQVVLERRGHSVKGQELTVQSQSVAVCSW